MKCQSIVPFLQSRSTRKDKTNFKGVPQRLGSFHVKDWQDAVRCWNFLKEAKYLDVHSDGENHLYRHIRESNYSFLNKLNSYYDKSEFVRNFCEFTGFPNLRTVSEKIDQTFKDCINKIARNLNSQSYRTPYSIVDYGYDPTCSLGLKKAFPGSDLDKGYIILEGDDIYKSDDNVVGDFKGKLWQDLDQRIVSLNHRDTFPSVYTKKQIHNKLTELNPIAESLVSQTTKAAILSATGAILADIVLGPFGVPLGMLLGAAYMDNSDEYIKIKNSNETHPFTAGEFNRKVAKQIDSSKKREEAKNFAFFIETVEANLDKNRYYKTDAIFDEIKDSTFVQNSNVNQIGAWQRKINNGYLKSKLRNREQLYNDFYKMTGEEKYELVKDLIKYSSDDQSSKFSKYFKNDDDIKGRYDSLLRELK